MQIVKEPFARYQLINHIAKLNGATEYLEVGIHDGACLHKIKIKNKTGVDPGGARGSRFCTKFYPLTSDDYFSQYPNVKFDIIFIDGLHTGDQVKQDIINAIGCLKDGGAIVLHDMNPATKERESPDINGDSWKGFVYFRSTYTGYTSFTLDSDQGLGVIIQCPKALPPLTAPVLDYAALDNNREAYLGLLQTKDALRLLDSMYGVIV